MEVIIAALRIATVSLAYLARRMLQRLVEPSQIALLTYQMSASYHGRLRRAV